MNLKMILPASIFALGLVCLVGLVGFDVSAGSLDTDSNLVPDSLDNCLVDHYGPNEGGLTQVGGELDGYGNACDADYKDDGVPQRSR